ncbi:hypothetical protein CY35_14G101300 [Sphagnum magellanicum]|nr:hypothetical protein CY35_14G101300 [Sphagnum magellanicum]
MHLDMIMLTLWMQPPSVVLIWKLYHTIWRSPPKSWKMNHLT